MTTKARLRRPKCDQCQILVINGVVCHELGCPNSWKGKTVECKFCGRDFKPSRRDQVCCSKSCVKAYYR